MGTRAPTRFSKEGQELARCERQWFRERRNGLEHAEDRNRGHQHSSWTLSLHVKAQGKELGWRGREAWGRRKGDTADEAD